MTPKSTMQGLIETLLLSRVINNKTEIRFGIDNLPEEHRPDEERNRGLWIRTEGDNSMVVLLRELFETILIPVAKVANGGFAIDEEMADKLEAFLLKHLFSKKIPQPGVLRLWARFTEVEYVAFVKALGDEFSV